MPLLVISPYAKHELRLARAVRDRRACCASPKICSASAQLAAADARATSPAGDCFDFTQKPRKFVPIKAPKGPEFFLHAGRPTIASPTSSEPLLGIDRQIRRPLMQEVRPRKAATESGGTGAATGRGRSMSPMLAQVLVGGSEPA